MSNQTYPSWADRAINAGIMLSLFGGSLLLHDTVVAPILILISPLLLFAAFVAAFGDYDTSGCEAGPFGINAHRVSDDEADGGDDE